jgi:transposase InsO family protein
MSWKIQNLMSQRHEFVLLASQPDANLAGLCRRFGISRRTGYKWSRRFRRGGAEALRDCSRRPHTSPSRTTAAVQAAVVALRQKHPAWGPRKLRRRLADLGRTDLPAPSTVAAILRREGCVDPTPSAQHQPWQRFERSRPNELWQMDFKGHFALGRGGRCHPLTVLDDHARFLLTLQACANEQDRTVRGHLITGFRRYGLPEALLCDNGPPWGGPGGQYTALAVWLLRLGVRVIHGRPFHPQTQGKDERFHRTLKAELLARADWPDLRRAQPRFDHYRDVYNLERPHEALGLAVPATRYQPSPRLYPEALPPLAYPVGEVVRAVKSKGEITFQQRFFYIGQAFAGLPVALRPTTPDGHYTVCLAAHRLGRIDLTQPNDRPFGNCFPLLPLCNIQPS